jgi:hypothetical protein
MRSENNAIVELAMAHLQRLENIGIVSHGDSGHSLDTVANEKYNHCFRMNKTIYFHDFHRNQS